MIHDGDHDQNLACDVREAAANRPLERLRHHVTGAIQRGEAEAIVEQPVRWEVQTRIGDGWQNCWCEDDDVTPLTFATGAEAHAVLDAYLAEQWEAYTKGDMEALYRRSEFQVAPAKRTLYD